MCHLGQSLADQLFDRAADDLAHFLVRAGNGSPRRCGRFRRPHARMCRGTAPRLRSASSARLRSLTSCAKATPNRRPSSRNDWARTSTGKTVPSLRRCHDSSAMTSPASSRRSRLSLADGVMSGLMAAGVIPISSSRVYPRLRHAWRLTSRNTQSSSKRKNASEAWSANIRRVCSLVQGLLGAMVQRLVGHVPLLH